MILRTVLYRRPQNYTSIPRSFASRSAPRASVQSNPSWAFSRPQHRLYAVKTEADEKIEELQELYATAKDEFEIASEETEKKTVYAADDRAAAHEELAKFKEAFNTAIEKSEPKVAIEIRSRVGQRVRELERAIEAMDESAKED